MLKVNQSGGIKGFAPRWLAPVMVLVLCSKPHLSIAFAVQGCRSEGGNI